MSSGFIYSLHYHTMYRYALQQQCFVENIKGGLSKQETIGGQGGGTDGRRGNWQKGTGQELCDWNPCHPLHSINSNTPAQMMHENPFMLHAGREGHAEKRGREIQRMDVKDRCISTGCGLAKPKWFH